jgi:L-asparagine transporter-like permease
MKFTWLTLALIIILIIFVIGIIFSTIENTDSDTQFSTLNKIGHIMMVVGMGLVLLLFLIYC